MSATARESRRPDSASCAAAPLPARSQAFAYVSIGSWLQDQALLPHTVNTAIAPVPLPRPSAEAEARIVAMNYRFTTRPRPNVWVNGQLKLYDYDNRTPRFPVAGYVSVDSGIGVSRTGGSEPFGYTRRFADVDLSYAPFRAAVVRLGYGRERDDRTFRFLDETSEETMRAAVDSSGLTWGSIRLQYERAVRTGHGLDEEVFSDIGEQVSLRQFDISDRRRDRVTAIAQVTPVASVGLNGSVGIGRENRPDAAFGLQDNDLRSFTVGLDLAPGDAATAGATYGFENYRTLQRSRQANPGPQFDDPTRDWSTDMNENVHTIAATFEVADVFDGTSARVGYDLVDSTARYRYLMPADSTLARPQQLPPVRNEIQRASVDIRRELGRRVSLGLGYAYDRYYVDDFALSPGTLNSPVFPTLVSLMYQWRPYTAHTGSVRLIYAW